MRGTNVSNANKSKRMRWTPVRHAVQLLMAVLFCLPPLAAGWGLFNLVGAVVADPVATPAEGVFFGTLSASSLFGINLLDPYSILQVAAASKSFALSWFVGLLPVLLVYGLLRGRVFCGWTCPVNLLLEAADWLRAKLKLKVRERVVPRHAKLWVALAVLVLSALLSMPVFELVSPLGIAGKGLALGSLTGGVTLIAILLVELFWGHRVWCRALCPLGGFYEAVGKVGQVNVKIDHEACIGCDACKRACLCDPEILDPALAGAESFVSAGDCMACGKCVDACPTNALKLGLGRK